MKYTTLLATSAACFVMLYPTVSIAQQTSAAQQGDTASSSNGPDSVQEGDIVVTAQRRSERLQDVPVSVQAVSATELRAAGINDQRQLSLIAPSLQVQADNNYSVRGVGTQTFGNTVESSVATAVDEVTLGSRILNNNPFLDVGQVEVLNGPQGLLFGKNASAGLVNITTTRPKIGVYGADFDVEAVQRKNPREDGAGVLARATLNIPVSGDSALRVSGIYRYDEPIVTDLRRNAVGRYDRDFRQFGLRGKYLYEPTSQLSIYLIGEYFENHGQATYSDASYRSLGTGSVNLPFLAADGIVPSSTNLLQSTNGISYRDLITKGAQANVSYEFESGWTLSDVLAWKGYRLNQQSDADATSGVGADINRIDVQSNQYSNELRLALPSGTPLSGQVGLYYFKSKLDQQSQLAGNNYLPSFLLPNFPFCVGATVRAPSPPGCAVSNSYFLGQDKNYTVENESYAAFGQFTYEIVNGLKLIAGGRVTRDKVSIDLTQNQGAYFVVLGLPNASFDQSYATTTFSWRGGAQYEFNRNIMAYATYGRGYKGPGMNDTGATRDAVLRVLPERADTLEIGIKSTLFDRLLTVNASLFRTKFANLQAQLYDPALRTFVIGNAAAATSKGAEVNVVIRPMRGLSLSANAAYVDAKFDSFPGAQCYVTQPLASCRANNTFDASGNRLTFAPKFTSTLGASYSVPIEGDLSFVIDGSYYHRSRLEPIVNAAPGSSIQPIDVLNGSIGVRSDSWSATIFCKNCTNRVYALSTSVESGDSNAGVLSITQRFGLDSVRQIGVRMGFNF